MDNNVIDAKKFERARRRAQVREWVGDKTQELAEWAEDHQEFLRVAIPFTTGAVALIAKGARNVSKRRKLDEERRLKENYCYDRSLGHYWELRRKLTNEEWRIIEARRANGERLADILNDLKVLK